MEGSAPQRGAGSDDSHRGNGSVAGIARWEHSCGIGCVRTSFSERDTNEDFPTEVEASFAPNAAVCGALGCRETAVLLSVKAEGEQRVLCSECVVDFVERVSVDE